MAADRELPLHVEVRWEPLTRPPLSPMADWSVTADQATLTLPGLGQVTMSAEGVVLRTETQDEREGLWARIGDWATAQVLQSRGITVARGAVIAEDDRMVLLTGPTRIGASLTAVIAAMNGWSVVCDGYVALGADGCVLNQSTEVTLDAAAVGQLGSGMTTRQLPTGRPRTAVKVPSVAGGQLTDAVLLANIQGLGSTAMTQVAVDSLPDDALLTGEFDKSLPSNAPSLKSVITAVPGLRFFALMRPANPKAEYGFACTPPGVTRVIVRTLRGESLA